MTPTIRNCKRGKPHPTIPGLFYWTKCSGKDVWVSSEKLLFLRNQSAEYVRKNRDKLIAYAKEYRLKNKEKIAEIIRKWYVLNRQHFREHASRYRRNRSRTDPIFRIRNLVARRIKLFLDTQNMSKRNTTFLIVGCTPTELKRHLEEKFTSGMHWGNHGIANDCWQIDHKIPMATAKTELEALALFHYSNLQPMWGKENRQKSDKIKVAA